MAKEERLEQARSYGVHVTGSQCDAESRLTQAIDKSDLPLTVQCHGVFEEREGEAVSGSEKKSNIDLSAGEDNSLGGREVSQQARDPMKGSGRTKY